MKSNVKKFSLPKETCIHSVLAGIIPNELPPADYYGMMKKLRAIGTQPVQTLRFFLAQDGKLGLYDRGYGKRYAGRLPKSMAFIQDHFNSR